MSGVKAREPESRVILLGASNLAKCISTVIETAQIRLGRPLEILTAMGHGRSYGTRSFLIYRSIPGILESRLWDVAREAAKRPTFALITDIGNDLMYGQSPETIAGWVEACLDRLDELGARTVITGLPVDRLAHISAANYYFFRTVFFPRQRMDMATALDAVHRLNKRIETLASSRGVPFVPFPRRWYGVDPIHLKRATRPEAWGETLRHWVDDAGDDGVSRPHARGSIRRTLAVRTRWPETWWLFGRIQRGGVQPSVYLPDGSTVAQY